MRAEKGKEYSNPFEDVYLAISPKLKHVTLQSQVEAPSLLLG